MKKLLFLLSATLLAVTLMFGVFAAENVVYLADGGTGDGLSASSPLGAITDAYAALPNGGTIVICGKYTVGNTSNVTLPANTSEITITSVFGGVDYRTTNSAILSFNGTSFLKLSGSTVFDAITMSLDKTAAGICANFNPVTITESVSVVQASGGTGYYMYLVIGTNADTVNTLGEGEVLHINVNGGKFINFTAFTRNIATTSLGTVVLNIGGNADIRDLCTGSLGANSYAGSCVANLSGNARVTNFYLGGYKSGGMKGDVAVNITDNASITAINNYNATFFPASQRYLNVYSENVTLPSGYAACFDTVTSGANVAFVKDGGSGNGLSPFTPTGSIQTAYAALGEADGTIVFVGDYTTTTTVKFPEHTGTVKLTSVYGGVDYRAIYGAGLHWAGTGFIKLYGPTVVDDINLELDKATAGFCANYNPLTVGYNVKTIHASGTDGYYLYIVGGPNGEATPTLAEGENNVINIFSGKYATVSGFSRSAASTSAGTVTLNIGGDVDIKELALGSITAGSGAGGATLSMSENANISKLYLGGYKSNGMSDDVTVNIDDYASIGTIENYGEAFFPSSTKTLNILSVDTSLPANYAQVFDTVTTVNQKLVATLTLPEDAPSSDKLTHLLINGQSAPYTMTEENRVVTVEFESVLDEVTISLTYKDESYQRISYTVTITDGATSVALAENKNYDGTVIYISDGGTGDGLTDTSPLATFADAYESLLADGGTVVVCGKLTMQKTTAPAHYGTVTITSVYGGVDYRTEGASLYYPVSSVFVLGGKTVFRDITLDFVTNGLISAANNPVVFDTGITINYDPAQNDEAGLYLVGGYNVNAIPQDADYTGDTSITLRSGSFSRVFGFSRYVGNRDQSGTANITLENDAHVRYLIAGATGNSATSNNANIKLSDGAIVETLYLGGLQKDNYMYGETVVDITGITTGTIYEFDGISLYAMANGTDTLYYAPATVPDGVLHLASLALVDNILSICDINGSHVFGDAYENMFDTSRQIHTCSVCGYTELIGNAPEKVAENVLFVANGGFGDGTNPAYPLGSYEDAMKALSVTGGTIVISGEYTIEANLSYKHGSDPSFFQEPKHTGAILVTSVYGGTDYRESGAKFVFNGLMDYKLSGPVTFDNINFDTTDASAANTIAARYNPLTMGDGCKMLKTYEADGYMLNIVGGYKYFRYTDFEGVEIEDEWLRLLNHVIYTNDTSLPDEGTLNIGNTVARAKAADAFNALWAEMEEKGMQLPIVSSAYQTYEWKHDFFANFLGNTRANHPDWDYERAYIYVTKSCGEPGRSEHHLGIAVDMYDNTINSDSPNHDYCTTEEWDWLVNQGNAAKHGIILRYPDNAYCRSATGFINEAWHFRYIGTEHANAYIESGYPIFEYYIADTLGLFEKDSSVTLNGGSYYAINGGSVEYDAITFTGTKRVTVADSVVYTSIADVDYELKTTVSADAGYYAESSVSENKVGTIVFNACIENYDELNIESFGFYIYNEGKVEKANVVSTDIQLLKSNDGKINLVVANIPVNNFASKVLAMPYAVINGETVSGNVCTFCVNDSLKWLGELK